MAVYQIYAGIHESAKIDTPWQWLAQHSKELMLMIYVTSIIALPSKNEQIEIVAMIKRVSKKYDRLMSHAEAIVALLKKRRTALISAAVTGKIDVRDWEVAV